MPAVESDHRKLTRNIEKADSEDGGSESRRLGEPELERDSEADSDSELLGHGENICFNFQGRPRALQFCSGGRRWMEGAVPGLGWCSE